MKKEQVQLTPEEELQVIIDKAKKKHGRGYKGIMNLVAYREEFAVDENGEFILDEEGNNVIKYEEDNDLTYELRQEEIAKMVIIHPAGIVENMAAVADIISTECMMKSGFGEPPTTEQC